MRLRPALADLRAQARNPRSRRWLWIPGSRKSAPALRSCASGNAANHVLIAAPPTQKPAAHLCGRVSGEPIYVEQSIMFDQTGHTKVEVFPTGGEIGRRCVACRITSLD
jgi:hypothetical protein